MKKFYKVNDDGSVHTGSGLVVPEGFTECGEYPEIPKTYIELRSPEYPSIIDQLDMIYWDMINGTTTWQDAITVIKNKYPKNGQ